MIALIIIFLIFLVSGSFFALPAFIPALRRHARQSPQYKNILTIALSLITFVVFFVGMTYTNAKIIKIFSAIASGPSYFWDDAGSDALLTQELWLRAMIPPWMQSDSTCLMGDIAVCEAATELRNLYIRDANRTMNYLIMLASLLIPATVCGVTVRYITRDHRKEKIKETV